MNHNNINLSGPTPSDVYLDHDDGNHFFTNKCMPMKTLDNTDYMIVSSEEIIDILDLTNDEVEQMFDDNMISSQDFDTLNSPRLSQSTQYNRVPRINLATNLTKIASPLIVEPEDKGIDMRPLETPTINLDTTTTTGTDVDLPKTNNITKLITMHVPITKKKSGRTKGARQISIYFYSFYFFFTCFLVSSQKVFSVFRFLCSISFSFILKLDSVVWFAVANQSNLSPPPHLFSHLLTKFHFSINFITSLIALISSLIRSMCACVCVCISVTFLLNALSILSANTFFDIFRICFRWYQ